MVDCSLVHLVTGVVLLVWLGLLSCRQTGPPSPTMYAAKRPVQNAAGRVGAQLAWALRYWLGAGVYVAALFGSAIAVIMLTGRVVKDLPWRVIGMVILVSSFSAMAHMSDPSGVDRLGIDSAGVLGTGIGHFLLTRFGTTGGWLVVLIMFTIGALLGADDLLVRFVRMAGKGWTRRGEIQAAAGSAISAARIRTSPAKAQPAPAGRSPAASAVPEAPADEKAAERQRRKEEKRFHREQKRQEKQEQKQARQLEKEQQKQQQKAPDPTPDKPAAVELVEAKAPQRENKPIVATPETGQPRVAPEAEEDYQLPSEDLLVEPKGGYVESQQTLASQNSRVLQSTLDNFNVDAQVVGHMTGPCITMFELQLAPGVKVSKVNNLSNDIARSLAVPGVRVVSPIPGKDTVGIEVPNADREIVRIRQLMDMSNQRDKKMHLPLYLGKDASGDPIIADLAAMPHMLLAGTTGSGKSVCINAIIMSMLLKRTPEEVRLILVDPKMVELAAFESIPHLLCPIINDMRKAEEILEWAAQKMDERYELLKEAGVRNIAGYNRLSEKELYARLEAETPEEQARIPSRLPYQVIIIDELADLMMTSSKEVELHIIRIAQKARAVGIHLVLATQRPSVDVVTGLIKSNMPCRISFRVASRQESRIILDQNGAEVLMGQGDMLFLQPGTSNVLRSQGAYVEDNEIRGVVKQLKKHGEPKFDTELMRLNSRPAGEVDAERDDLFDKAVEVILTTKRGSVSLLQRKLQIGYTRASRIVDQMAEAGILGDYKGSQARECLISLEDWESIKAGEAADLSGENTLNGEGTSV